MTLDDELMECSTCALREPLADRSDRGDDGDRYTHSDESCGFWIEQGGVVSYYRPLLCVGGPLDGQYRVLDGDVFSFRATIPLPPGVPASGRVADTSVEYLRIWSREHGRFVWWYAS